jgi:hypothetical protein
LSQECGGITEESESGKGTSFALYFPRVDAVVKPDSQAATKPESQSGADMPGRMETILFIEDQRLVGRLPTARLHAEEPPNQASIAGVPITPIRE